MEPQIPQNLTQEEAFSLALAQQNSGNLEEAERLYKAILNADPNHFASWNNLGALYAARGAWPAARAAFYEIVRRRPDAISERMNYLQILMASQDTAAAEAEADAILSMQPDAAIALRIKGILLYRRRAAQEALSLFDLFLQTNPQDEDGLFYRQRCLMLLGRMDEARAAGQRLLKQRDQMALAQSGGAAAQAIFSAPPFDPTQRDRNIIAYSYWRDDDDVRIGLIDNAERARAFYPEWTMRVYCSEDMSPDVRNALSERDVQVYVMPKPPAPHVGPYWRLLALDDAQASTVLLRSAESRLNPEERLAVNEWLASGLPFHVMRDHISHEEPITANLWGARIGALPPLTPALTQWLVQPQAQMGEGVFLRLAVWPAIRHQTLVHDSQYDVGAYVRPFPQGARRNPPLFHGAAEKSNAQQGETKSLSLEEAFEMAVRYHRSGHLDQALKIYDGILAVRPDHRDARMNRATLIAARGDLRGALATFHDQLKLEPHNGELWNNIGVILRQMNQVDEAARAFEKAVSLSPDSIDARFNLGLSRLSEPQKALEHFTRVLALEPGHHDAMMRAMGLLFQLRRPQEGLALGRAFLQARDEAIMNAWRTRFQDEAPPNLNLGRWRAFDASKPERNAIAFSLFGQDARHEIGARANLRLARRLFPSWHVRIYHDDSLRHGLARELADEGARLIMMPHSEGRIGVVWRMLASDDESLDYFLCRNIHGRLNHRDKTAVEAWLSSGQPFHLMRDAPFHCDLMMPELWGGAAGILPPLAPLLQQFIGPHGGRGMERDFLRMLVWPLIRDKVLTHDAYFEYGLNLQPLPPEARLPPPYYAGMGFDEDMPDDVFLYPTRMSQ